MRQLLLIIAAMLPIALQAQDVITKKNGQNIRGKVLSVTPTDISYKTEKSPDGTTFTVSKDEVLSISYDDGTSTNFARSGTIGMQPIQAQAFAGDSIKPDGVNTYRRGDLVLFKNERGRFRKGLIIGLKPTFAIVKASGGTREMPYDQIAKFEDK
ncbi:MAG: hypothetical protein JSS82_14595 [Bacteroidetes bacterium]|nr:hypothetical protein [Bacteroidota bacterium]